jgi:hypothetical protein
MMIPQGSKPVGVLNVLVSYNCVITKNVHLLVNYYKLGPGFFVFYKFLDSCLVIPNFFFFNNLQI